MAPHASIGELTAKMAQALARKLSGFFKVDEALEALLGELCVDVVEFPPGSVIVGQDAPYGPVHLIESGWVVRAKHLQDGGRQIVNLAVAGDFVGLNALLFETSDFHHECKTAVIAFRIDANALRRGLATMPNLAPALFWANAHEEAILAERIVSLGRRTARARAAHVLCEIIARLEIVMGPVTPEVAIPLSQQDMADILGINVVHANRVLRALEREGVATFRKGLLLAQDVERMRRIAGFEAGYRHFTRRLTPTPAPLLLS